MQYFDSQVWVNSMTHADEKNKAYTSGFHLFKKERCKICNAALKRNAVFCANCGARLAPSQSTVDPFPAGKILIIVLCAVVLAAAVIAAVLCIQNSHTARDDTAGQDLPQKDQTSIQTSEADPVLTVATNAPYWPYIYYDEKGALTGIDADLAGALADKLDKQIEWLDMKYEEIEPALQSGQADIAISAIPYSEQREKEFLVSDSYAAFVGLILTTEDFMDQIDQTGFSGLTVGLLNDSSATILFEWRYADTPDMKLQYADTVSDLWNAMREGSVDCVALDSYLADYFYAYDEENIKVYNWYYDEQYVVLIAPGRQDLQDAVNIALDELYRDGTLNKIAQKHYSRKIGE